MLEPPRRAAYGKDSANETALLELQRQLAPLHAQLVEQYAHSEPPLVFVIGMARSGTTLVSQLLAAAGFGYTSNFLARFWQVPTVGALIEKLTLRPGPDTTPSFRSTHGVTVGWAEPHEFGYFWNRWFDLGQDSHQLDAPLLARVNGYDLKRELAALQELAGRPLVFKNNTWCSLQARFLGALCPRAVFVVCRRQAQWIAQSLLQGRIARYGSRETWWSIRPATFAALQSLPWADQIARQVVDFERAMNLELQQIEPARIVEAAYEEVCADPARVVARTSSALQSLDSTHTPDFSALPPSFASANRQQIGDEDWQAISTALHRTNIMRDN